MTAKELEQAKTYAIGVHAIRQQSGGAVLGEIVDAYLFGRLAELEEFEARVRGGDRGGDAGDRAAVLRSRSGGWRGSCGGGLQLPVVSSEYW